MERALGSVPVTLPGGGRDWRGQDALLLLEQPWRGEGPSSVTTGKATLRSQAAPRSPKLKASRFLSRSWDTPITVETPRTQGHHGRKTRETWRWGAGPLKAAAPPPPQGALCHPAQFHRTHRLHGQAEGDPLLPSVDGEPGLCGDCFRRAAGRGRPESVWATGAG